MNALKYIERIEADLVIHAETLRNLLASEDFLLPEGHEAIDKITDIPELLQRAAGGLQNARTLMQYIMAKDKESIAARIKDQVKPPTLRVIRAFMGMEECELLDRMAESVIKTGNLNFMKGKPNDPNLDNISVL